MGTHRHHWGIRLRHLLEYALFRLFVGCCRVLPDRGTARLAQAVAWGVHHWGPRRLTRYQIAFENLQQAYPDLPAEEIDRRILAMWQHLLQLLAEVIQVQHRLTLRNFNHIMEFRNRPQVLRAMLGDRPVLFLSGHVGNWEVALRVLGLFGFPMKVVARRLDNPYMDRWMQNFRCGTGHQSIDKNGGGTEMVETLERGGCLALLGDQDAGASGTFVDFFGKPASTFRAIPLLALQYDALIVVGGVQRLESGPDGCTRYELACEEVIDPREIQSDDPPREILERYHRALERIIQRAPAQYFWVHKRWKSKPEDRRLKRLRKRAA